MRISGVTTGDDATRRVGATVWLVVAAMLAAATFAATTATLKDSKTVANCEIFDGDLLWPAQLYDDVFVKGYPYASYRLPGANSFFPDVGLYFLFRSITGSVHAAMVPQYVAMILLLAFTSASAMAACAPIGSRQRAVAVSLSFTALLFACFSLVRFRGLHVFSLSLAFLPVHHGGAVSCTFAAIALVVAFLHTRSQHARIGCGVALTALSAAIVASDRIFMVWCTIPASLVLATFAAWPLPAVTTAFGPRRRLIMLIMILVGGSLLGSGLAILIHAPGGDCVDQYFSSPSFSGLLMRSWLLMSSFLAMCGRGAAAEVQMLLWTPIAAAIAGRWLWTAARRPLAASPPQNQDGVLTNPLLALFCLLFCVMLVVNVAVFLTSNAAGQLLGTYPWTMYRRYFLGPELAALYGWPLLLVHRILPSRWLAGTRALFLQTALVPAVTACGLLAIAWQGRHPDGPAFNDYPDEMRRLDEACATRGLRYGLGVYAMARWASLLSKADVHLRPVQHDPALPMRLVPLHHTTNAVWYWQAEDGRDEDLRYTFIVADRLAGESGLTPTSAEEVFGEPAELVPLGKRYVLMVYDRPDDIVHQSFTQSPGYLELRRRYGGDDHESSPAIRWGSVSPDATHAAR